MDEGTGLLEHALARHRVLVTCGTGGVGKTTLSAALGIAAAREGRRVIVVTIDPAKRLVTSLGLEALGDEPRDLTAALRSLGPCTGELWALMPDTRRTFERFVESLAPEPAAADRVKQSRIFQIFAREYAGTNEYMAMEKLKALADEGRFDLIILDTPPSQNTLQFLEAPQLLARFFDERIIKWLVLPSNKIVSAAMRAALGMLERLTGAGFMKDLYELANSLFRVRAQFVANLSALLTLLRSPEVGFVLVASAERAQLEQVRSFVHEVRGKGFHFAGVLLNRLVSEIPHDPSPPSAPDSPSAEASASAAIADPGLQLLDALAHRETIALAQLAEYKELIVLARMPELARDVHSLPDLAVLAERLRRLWLALLFLGAGLLSQPPSALAASGPAPSTQQAERAATTGSASADEPRLLYQQGHEAYRRGAFADAVLPLTRLIARHPSGYGFTDAHLFLGLARLRLGEPQAALEPLRFYIQAQGQKIEGVLTRPFLAEALLVLGRYSEAEAVSREVLALSRSRAAPLESGTSALAEARTHALLQRAHAALGRGRRVAARALLGEASSAQTVLADSPLLLTYQHWLELWQLESDCLPMSQRGRARGNPGQPTAASEAEALAWAREERGCAEQALVPLIGVLRSSEAPYAASALSQWRRWINRMRERARAGGWGAPGSAANRELSDRLRLELDAWMTQARETLARSPLVRSEPEPGARAALLQQALEALTP